jgi:hypothetical protein
MLNYNFPKIKFCRRGHAIVGTNIQLATTGVMCRKCCALARSKYLRSGKLTERTKARITLALDEVKPSRKSSVKQR